MSTPAVHRIPRWKWLLSLTALFVVGALGLRFGAPTADREGERGAHAKTTIEIIGVYPVEATEPVHLIEVRCRGVVRVFDVGMITQETPGQPQSNWQVPYMEHILSTSGDYVLTDDFEAAKRPELWQGEMRLVFFFHYINFTRPLKTPFGDVTLPAESELPKRLSIIMYEAP